MKIEDYIDNGVLLGTGWNRQSKDKRDYTIDTQQVKGIYALLKTVTLPTTVDLRQFCTPIEDQGNLGSCTAHSAIGALEYLENKFYGQYRNASRLFTYYTTRHDIAGDVGDVGATIRDSVKSLVKYGSCLEEHYEYDIDNFENKPNSTLYKEAEEYQAKTYVSLANLQEIKETLNGGIPVDFGFNVYDSVSNSANIPYPVYEDCIGGHAVLAVGYDDNRVIKRKNGVADKGALLIRNSWGESWGDKGYGWLPYKYVTAEEADDFWAILTSEFPIVEPTPEPEPESMDGSAAELAELMKQACDNFLQKLDTT